MSEAKPIPLVRATILHPVVGTLGRLVPATHVERLLARVGLPPWPFRRPETLVPMRQAVRFLEEAARTEGIPGLGFRAGRQASIAELGVFGRLVVRARTLGRALATAVAAGSAFDSGSRWWLERSGERVRLCHAFVRPFDGGHHEADQYSLALAINLVRLAAGPGWLPDEAQLELRPGDHERDVDFDPKPTFGPATAITFPSALLALPLHRPASSTLDLRDVARWLASGPATDLPGSLRQTITSLMPTSGPLRLHVAAEALGVSVRTFQRRLLAAGLNLTTLVRTSRMDLAEQMLADTNAKVVDIALDLGYSEHAHFTRAFHRWTGLPPCAYRRHVHRDRLSARPTPLAPRVSPSHVARPSGTGRGTSRPKSPSDRIEESISGA
jgi:AraC-like DNA-binding protein